MEHTNKIHCYIVVKNDNFVLRDHRVHQVRIMPGVTILDFIYKLLQAKGFQLDQVELRNILFKEAVATTEFYDKKVYISIHQDEAKPYWTVVAQSRKVKKGLDLEDEWVENLRCELHMIEAKKETRIDIEGLKRIAFEAIDMDRVYLLARQVDIHHYEFMKGLGTLYKGEQFVLAEISLSSLSQKYREQFYLHPALLDCSTLIPFFHDDNIEVSEPFIPLFIERFRAFDSLGGKCYVYVDDPDRSRLTKDILTSHYAIYNENGYKIASFDNLSAKRIRSREFITKYQNHYNEESVSTNTPSVSVGEKDVEQVTIKDDLRQMIATVRSSSIDDIEPQTAFYDQGLDSTELLDLVKQIEKKVNSQLYPTLLFEYTNIEQLTDYLTEEYGEQYESYLKSQYKHSSVKQIDQSQTAKQGEKIVQNGTIQLTGRSQIERTTDIAIIGLSGRYPQSPDLRSFWENVSVGEDCITEVPTDHWNVEPYFTSDPSHKNKTYSKWGGFLSDVDKFDPVFFRIAPSEAEKLDPQLRLMLETAWHTVEDAGYTPDKLSQNKVGVYVGVMNNDYTWVASENYTRTGEFNSPGNYNHELANRISYCLDFNGPSLTIETACSSSLTAVHMAKSAIINGECTTALAGGVNLSLHQSKYMMLSELNILSPDGTEKTFDKEANGYVPAEGGGMVLLKSLEQAITDGDHIYGIIKSSSINHSGSEAGQHVPNVKSLARLAKDSIEQAGVDPEQIGYIEAHGTGTSLGDRLELKALEKAVRAFTDKKNFCALGSKANFGHLESASGICSLTKVLLSLKLGQIPKCANVNRAAIPLDDYPFYIPQETEDWTHDGHPRVAAINSFGIGGANSFMVIEEFVGEKNEMKQNVNMNQHVIALSARKEKSLKKYVHSIVEFLDQERVNLTENHINSFLSRMAYTLQTGRQPLRERLAVVVSNIDELKDKLVRYVSGDQQIDNLFRGNAKEYRVMRETFIGEAKQDVNKLIDWAERWVSGEEMNWETLYPIPPQKMSLPTYPFDRKSYWISKTTGSQNSPKNTEDKMVFPPVSASESFGDTDQVYFRHVWEKKNIPLNEAWFKGPILLLDTDEHFRNVLQKKFSREGNTTKVILVKPGEAYQCVAPDIFEIQTDRFNDYEQLITTLKHQNALPSSVIYLWSKDNNGHVELDKCLQSGVYSVFSLTKALMKMKLKHTIRLLYVHAQNKRHKQVGYGALAGLFKTIQIENPRFIYKSIAIESPLAESEELIDVLLNEFQMGADDSQVRYAQGNRYTRVLRPFDPPVDQIQSPILKDHGVYLITGGLGGVGFIFARFIAQQVHAKLVLIGRSVLSPDKEAKLRELRSLGAEVVYLQGDITRQKDVNELIRGVKSLYNELHGIIHSAGIIRDGFVIQKEEEEIEKVIAPKVYGSVYLDEASKDEPLDFFVLFSSTAGVMGNAGQSDYSFANSFMSDFAEERDKKRLGQKRNGKTLSISWPLWLEGGMKVDQQTEQQMLEKFGISPMTTETGLRAFQHSLSLPDSHIVVVEGDRQKIINVIGSTDEKPIEQLDVQVQSRQNKEIFNSKEHGVQKNRLFEYIRKDVLSVVMNILKIDEEDIDMDTEISDFGFDSVLLTQFSEHLSDTYHESIYPSVFFEYRTLGSLVDYLADEYREKMIEHYQIGVQEAQNDIKKQSEAFSTEKIIEQSLLVNEISAEDGKESVPEPVAIIGMDGKMPQSDDLDCFWENIEQEKDLITEVPRDRWDWTDNVGELDDEHEPIPQWGGFMNDIDKFDPLFFGISPWEAELMDPQQRLFMETVWKTIENAGYKPSALSGTRTALFVGVGTTDYRELYQKSHTEVNAQTTTGTSNCILANRISYLLNIHGPSEPIDTACSSSLVAVHRAVEAIQYGQCEMAIAGGVNVIASPTLNVSFHKAGMLAGDGRCKTFDNKADGYVRGEGTGALLLKPLRQAEADGNHIYGVIRGSEVNHGGHANSLTSPNPAAQKELLVRAYRKAGVNPASLSYIEAHGTGTSLGDPIEIEGLKKAFDHLYTEWGIHQSPQQYCGLGSVKTNIGHLETAAGIAGVFKVLLGMKHNKIPATLHFDQLNQYIQLEESPFYIVDKSQPWEYFKDAQGRRVPRRAGVSSFGFGGVNAHVILEEYEQPASSATQHQQPELIVLSAKNKERLAEYVKKLIHDVEKKGQEVDLSAMAYTLQTGREPMEERLALVVSSVRELQAKLAEYQRGEKEKVNALYQGNATKNKLNDLLSGRAGTEFIKVLTMEREYERLAKLWVSGLEFDWNLLHTKNNRRRVPLPTYPFAREKYWIPSPTPSKEGKDRTVLHPLLDNVDMKRSVEKGVVLRKHLKRMDQIVQEHLVKNKPTLPGVGYLEMAHAAVLELIDDLPQNISDVYWLQPLFVEDTKEIHIVISEDEGHLKYEIQSEERGDTVIHGKGRIDSTAAETEEQKISITDIKKRYTTRMEPSKLYSAFTEVGLSYGSSFQGIQEVWKGSDEALSYIDLPEGCVKEMSLYTMHPMLMDAALQTLASLNIANMEKGKLKIPFAASKVEVLRPVECKGYAYVQMIGEDRYHITVTDIHGIVCIRLYDLIVKEMKGSGQDFLYITEWEASSVVSEQVEQETGSALIIYTEHDMGLAQALRDKHHEAFCIRLGSQTRQIDKYNWEAQTNKRDSFELIIQKLPQINTVYYLGGIQEICDDMYCFAKGDDGQEQGVLSLFRLIKVLHRTGYLQHSLEIKVVTNNVHQIMNEHITYPYAASLFGFAKSLAKEYPNWSISCIDVNLYSEEVQSLVDSILDEKGSLAGNEVVIRDDVRYVQRIKPLQLPQTEEIPFRQNGVYVILGGTGGIGMELSRYLAKTVQAKLVLLGRSPLSANQKEQITQIEAMGAKVLHIHADASDLSSMKQAVSQAKETFGMIHGAIHSAIVLNDKALANMDEETFQSALAPKVAGSVNLYEALKDQSLDFMMFFSSVQSLLGSAGQSNYAAGSTFKDAWARYLNKYAPFPVKLINWGYWGEIGVVATEEYYERMEKKGIKSIYPEEGMDVIQRILVSPVTQVIPFKASNDFLKQMGVQLQKCDRIYSEKIPSLIETTLQEVEKEWPDGAEAAYHQQALKKLKHFAQYLLLVTFQRMGVFNRSGEIYDKESLKEQMHFVPAYSRLYEGLLNILEEGGFIRISSEQVITMKSLDSTELQKRLQEIEQYKDKLLNDPKLESYVKLMWVCVNAYPSVLTGKQSHMEVMFPAGSTSLVKNIYSGNNSADYNNLLVAQLIKNYIKQRLEISPEEKLIILEVGAGTGATSHFVFEAIKEYSPNIKYLYTDVSPGFTKQGEKIYGKLYPFVEFKVLDIEYDLVKQGFQTNSVDIVFGSNVIHATKNIKSTLDRIKALLKANGITVINEVTNTQEFLTLTFGLTEGWWLFEDEEYRLPHSPLLSSDTWQSLLALTGYKCTRLLGIPGLSDEDKNQSIIVAESDGRVTTTVSGKQDLTNEYKADVSIESRPIFSHKNDRQTILSSELQSKTIDLLKEQFAEVLKIKKERIDHKTTFEAYGVDSLVMVKLNAHLEKEFGKLPPTLLFEHMTIEKLSLYFMEKHRERLIKLLTAQTTEEVVKEEVYRSNYEEVVIASEETHLSDDEHLQAEEVERFVDSLSEEEVDALFNKIAGL